MPSTENTLLNSISDYSANESTEDSSRNQDDETAEATADDKSQEGANKHTQQQANENVDITRFLSRWFFRVVFDLEPSL